jgi:2-polyprenyl-3-methyl-5-hydroxy-6-metoxy-1,4-benzoquinol methylase
MAVQQQPAIDEAKVEAFMEKVIGDYSGTMTMALCTLGDRLGLFKQLAESGPATSEELADRAGVNKRYCLEWLRGMASAGYLDYDRSSGRFSLPAEHALALAQEGGPFFLGGGFQMLPAGLGVLDELAERFRRGGGVSQDAYSDDWWDGMQRFTDPWFQNSLVQVWIPAMPEVKEKLEGGALVADVGCGSGRASIKLAKEFPNSRYVGYDISDAQIERANANAKAAGVDDRVTFRKLDVARGLPEKYDVITTFDVIHDAADPQGLLKAIRDGLKDDGIYVCLDINCQDNPEDNEGPLAAMFYGFSMLYCMTTSLAKDGEGLGTCGLPEAKLRELCEKAGFSEVRRVPLEDPFNNLYEIKA